MHSHDQKESKAMTDWKQKAREIYGTLFVTADSTHFKNIPLIEKALQEAEQQGFSRGKREITDGQANQPAKDGMPYWEWQYFNNNRDWYQRYTD